MVFLGHVKCKSENIAFLSLPVKLHCFESLRSLQLDSKAKPKALNCTESNEEIICFWNINSLYFLLFPKLWWACGSPWCCLPLGLRSVLVWGAAGKAKLKFTPLALSSITFQQDQALVSTGNDSGKCCSYLRNTRVRRWTALGCVSRAGVSSQLQLYLVVSSACRHNTSSSKPAAELKHEIKKLRLRGNLR